MSSPMQAVPPADTAPAPHYGPIHVRHAADLTVAASQSSGMTRYEAIAGSTVGTQHLRMGRVVTSAGLISSAHHHGDCETAVYLVRGSAVMLFGPDLRERISLAPGDFLFVPPWTIHAEANLGSEDAEFIVAQSSPVGITVNLPEILVPHDLLASP